MTQHRVTDLAQSDVTASGHAVTIKYWHFVLCSINNAAV